MVLETYQLDKTKPLPKHIAIIMDGNGRWATKRGLVRLAGHRAGVKNLREILETVKALGIDYLTVFAFSTENWKRPNEEVDGLMALLIEFMDKELEHLTKEGIRINAIGELSKLPQNVIASLSHAMEKTKDNSVCTFNIALNYGARQEILEATKKVAKLYADNEVSLDEVDEALFSSCLYTKNQPDPDLLIRTSGELRISNFLLWQIAYAEIWVTPIFWPDFRKSHLIEGIQAYQARNRRFGGLSK